jgi:hypothetical protein
MNRYFKLPHELEGKLHAIATGYIKKMVHSICRRRAHSLAALHRVPLFDKPDGAVRVPTTGESPPSLVSHLILRPNRMLIVCVPRNQVYTHTV